MRRSSGRPDVSLMLSCVFLFSFTVSCVCVCAGCTKRTGANLDGEYRLEEVWYTSASPGGDYVAFTLLTDISRLPWAVYVIDASGRLRATASPGANPRQSSQALQWFPDGVQLLCLRQLLGESDRSGSGSALFILNAKTGAVIPVDLGEHAPENARVIAARTVIYRTKGSTAGGKPGLYLAVEGDPSWQISELLPDTGDYKWNKCLWGRQTDSGLQLIVEARGGSTSPKDIITFWNVQVGPEGLLKRQLICKFDRFVRRSRVSPDGSHLAVIAEPSLGTQQVWLYRTEPADGTAVKLEAQRNIHHLSFRPDGRELLLWKGGFLDPTGEIPAYALLADLTAARPRELSIVEEVPSMSWAAWLSNDSLVIGVHGQGIVKLNLKTGKHSYLWRMPGAVK
jgi:hypothetical protein